MADLHQSIDPTLSASPPRLITSRANDAHRPHISSNTSVVVRSGTDVLELSIDARFKPTLLKPQRQVYQCNEHRHFDQGPDDRCKRDW